MSKKIFVNIPVKDLKRSMEFFTAVGFTFNLQFTNENAAAMSISNEIYFMLVAEPYFKTFTVKEIASTKTTAEAIFALGVDSKSEVDSLVDKAMNAGAGTYNEPKDYGFMFTRSFQDPDDHLWEIFYMDPNHVQKS